MYRYKICSNFFNDKLVINGLFLKKKTWLYYPNWHACKNIDKMQWIVYGGIVYGGTKLVTIVHGGTKLQVVVY